MCQYIFRKQLNFIPLVLFHFLHLLVLLSQLLNQRWYQHGVLTAFKHRLCSCQMYQQQKLPGSTNDSFCSTASHYVIFYVMLGYTNWGYCSLTITIVYPAFKPQSGYFCVWKLIFLSVIFLVVPPLNSVSNLGVAPPAQPIGHIHTNWFCLVSIDTEVIKKNSKSTQ